MGVRLGASRSRWMTLPTCNEGNVLAVVEARTVGVEGGFRRSTTEEVVISRKGRRFSFSALDDAALSQTLLAARTDLLDSICSILSSGTGFIALSRRSSSEGRETIWFPDWTREFWLSGASADIGETIVIVCDKVENSGAGNFGDRVKIIGRYLARDELTFSTGGGEGVQGSFPFASGVSTTIKVELKRRQLLVRDAGELH